MERSLLDSDILSELLRGKNSVVLRRGAAYRQVFGLYTTSVVTVFEIISGFRQLRLESRIADFENSMSAQEVLPLDKESALLAGRIHGDLVRHRPNHWPRRPDDCRDYPSAQSHAGHRQHAAFPADH